MSLAQVAIVGSGVAGATLAWHLLESGTARRVTMFEAGAGLPRRDQRRWLDFATRRGRGNDARHDEPHEDRRDRHDDLDLVDSAARAFKVVGGRLFVRGGSTTHWGGWCPRFKPEDFALRSQSGHGADWPFDYSALEPYYVRAEHFMQIAGDSDSRDPPRSARYPLPAVPLTQMDGEVATALEALGLDHSQLPVARNRDCVLTGTCKYCPTGGIYSAAMTLDNLDAVFGERFELRLRSPVLRLVSAAGGSVAALEYRDPQAGCRRRFEADLVLLCAGVIETPKLLFASADGNHPQGPGNGSRHLGRHLLTHRLLEARGTRDSNPMRMAQELDFPTLACRFFDSPAYQPEGKLFFVRGGFLESLRTSLGAIAGAASLSDVPTLVAKTEDELRDKTQFSLIGFVEAFEPETGNWVAPGSRRNAFGLPSTVVRYAEHPRTERATARHAQMLERVLRKLGCRESTIEARTWEPRSDHAVGTCRASRSDADGVVDADLRVHDTGNLYVCSNAVMPNVTAVNPTLTLTALAIRLAAHLRERFGT